VLTPWNPGSMAPGSGPSAMINLYWPGKSVLVVLM
jgi:hypothetical protein